MTTEPGSSASAIEELASDYGAYIKFDIESDVSLKKVKIILHIIIIKITKNN